MSLDLSAAVAAVRDGWPGHHFTRDAALFEAQTVRDGGATACLIEYAVETAAPLIEAQVRAQAAEEIESYTDAVLGLVDTRNGARLAFIEIVRIAREGRL